MAVPPSPHRSSSSNQPSPNYHYQRSPSSSGPPVFPSGMPVNRSHVSSAGQKSPTKGASRPTSVVGKGTPSRRMDVSGGGHGATRSMDSTSRLVGTSSTSPTPVNLDEIERDFQNMMVRPFDLSSDQQTASLLTRRAPARSGLASERPRGPSQRPRQDEHDGAARQAAVPEELGESFASCA